MTDLIEMLRTTSCEVCRGSRELAADEIEQLITAKQGHIERLNCALTISRGKHENAIAEIERLTKENHNLRWGSEQYSRLADYVIPRKNLWADHNGSHTDSVIREIERLQADLDEYLLTVMTERERVLDSQAEVERLQAHRDALQDECDEWADAYDNLVAWCEQTNPDAYEKWRAVQAEFERLRAALEDDNVESNNA